jgi:hypothetical protein
MSEIGRITARIETDETPAIRGINRTESRISNFSSKSTAAFKAVAVAGIAAMSAAIISFGNRVRNALTEIDELAKSARQLGISVESFQRLSFAAERAGTNVSGLTQMMPRLSRNLVDAASGSGRAAETLEQLGLSASELIGLDFEQQLLLIGDALGQIENKTEQAAAAQDLLGRSGAAQLNLLTDGLRESSDRFDELGVAISDTAAKMVEEFNDARGEVATVFNGLIQRVTIAVIPLLNRVLDSIGTLMDSFRDFRELGYAVGIVIVTMFESINSAIRVVSAAVDILQMPVIALQGTFLALSKVIVGTLRWIERLFRSGDETALQFALDSINGQLQDTEDRAQRLLKRLDDHGRAVFHLSPNETEAGETSAERVANNATRQIESVENVTRKLADDVPKIADSEQKAKIDEMAGQVKQIAQQEMNVRVSVEASKDFIVKILSDPRLKQETETTVSAIFEDTARADRR